ncbi:MAG TPA: hypothetical protein DCP38_13005 [Acidobacteria bacterium]|jgi:LPS export ABC transporter permease LptG/LPS export ABC transporter permease LptF|nr:LptF/LptG family permease [Vicinamibacterales bacterium]HAK56376.1 hypothetical protein [Acidobacteriota bacterium]|tara:strand:- start:7585 stop:9912 length:2328 start_codon:yes stop_codon:yes gene_type:complete
MFRILDRYLVREIVPPFLLALLVFTFILMIPPLMDVAENLIAKGVAAPTILRIMLTLVPQSLGVTIPMAFLMGLLIGLGRLSADREAVALQACGVSLGTLLRPILAIGAVAAAATTYVLVVALPDANQAFRELTYSVIASRAQDEVKPRVFFEDFPNVVLYVRDAPPDSSEWTDVFLADTRNPAQPEIFVAERGRMLLDRDERRVAILLENGTRHAVTPELPEEYEVHEFDRMAMSLDPETVFPRVGPQRGYPELTIEELEAEAGRLEEAGLSPHGPIMWIHRKFSIPAACFVFALIGLAFGVSSRKDGKLASFVIGIGVIFAYYVCMYMAEAAAKGGLVSPHMAMWLPNVALGVPGLAFVVQRSFMARRRLSLPFRVPVSWGVERQPVRSRTAAPAGKGRNRVKVVVRLPHFWLPSLNLLDRYVLKHYLRIVGLAFVGMLGIFYIATFIDLSDKLFKGETTGRTLLEYFWFATPQYIYYVLPISALVATLVTIGLLTKSSELVVMKACGISLYRAAVPLVLFGVIWSGALFGLGETVLASANRRAEAIRHVIRGGSPQTFDVLNRKWIVAPDGAIYNYTYLDPRRQELHGFSIYQFEEAPWRLTRRTFVNKAVFSSDWSGEGVWVRSFRDELGLMPYQYIGDSPIRLQPLEFFVTERPDAERMSYRQLQEYIGQLQASGFSVVQLAVALQRKLSFPLVTVVMTLIAVPFAVMTGRGGPMYAIGVGLVLAITYWVAISVFGAVGAAGLLAPALAAWAPNILFSAGASYLLLTVRT